MRTFAIACIAAALYSTTVAAAPAAPAAPPAAQTAPAPCEDFHAHANWQAWGAQEHVPDSFAALQALSLQRQRSLLEELAAAEDPDPLATFWRAANDAAAIERAGTTALQPWLEEIDALRKPRDVAGLLARAHAAGLPLLFRFDIGADLREPSRSVAYARQDGLGLPDRDYYLREDASTQALRSHYRAYVARVLSLLGTPAAQLDADVAAILDIETRLARASLSQVQLRDPNNSWLPSTLADVQGRYTHLDWKGFLRTIGQRKLRGLSLAHTAFFVEADHLVGALPTSQWQAYLRFHLAHAMAPHLPQAFRDAHFALYGRLLEGREAPLPQWQRALLATDAALGERLGAAYAQRWLSEADAARARAIAEGLVQALKQRIGAAPWLGEAARQAGTAKLDALEIVIGHADAAPSTRLPQLAADSHAANVLALAQWRQQAALESLGTAPRPVPLRGHHVQAFHDPSDNRLAVSAAFLAPPVLPGEGGRAREAGALGTLLGHELSHAVDLQGANVGADGTAGAWWAAEDFQRFTERTKSLVAQYDAYRALSDVTVHGSRTFQENLADLAGVEIAWDLLQAGGSVDEAAARRFFEAFAAVWSERADAQGMRLALATGLHAPARWRVLGPLANFAPFAATYGCSADSGFVRLPADRVTVWH